jgi:adenine-specific DNA-methyltransferase
MLASLTDRLVAGYDENTFREFINLKCAGSFAPFTQAVQADDDAPWAHAEQLGIVKHLPGPNDTNRPLLVVAAELPVGEVLRERSSRLKQFALARVVLEDAVSNPSPDIDGLPSQGLFVFHDRDGNFRLSLVYATPKGTKLEWSTFKRYSFYVEAGAGNKTFRDRAALPWTTFDQLSDAFSVEKLTKEFYRRLFDWYQRAMDSPEVVFPNDIVTDREQRAVKSEQIIRLITRLMFVWFLKQKHLVPDTLFDAGALREVLTKFDPASGFTYYRAILQNLFFATLNSEIPDRAFAADGGIIETNAEHFDIKTLYRYGGDFAWSRDKVLQLFHGIPFLNGGLFECLDRGRNYYDGFSRNTEKQARVPNALFFDETNGLLPLLRQYNFTVEENSPGDEEVALDPELLGKVFENLLAAYNPETNVQARKATGSFYTPREIVNYMVDESLIAHLTTKCGENHETEIRALFSEGVAPEDPRLTHRIDEVLTTARILDPACGSGAFPVGALLRMVDILRTVRRIPEDQSVYDLKLELIENAIYGADIQTIAVQISKLRFFISLIAEQQPTADAEHNYGIHSLPNLETKFVAANSLIGLPRRTDALPMHDVENLKKHLWEVRHRHFQARSYREKKELRKQDLALRTALAESLEDGGGFDTEAAHLMAAWDPYDQNTSATFLDPEWMFNVRDGFDVVIGNPPYVRHEEIKEYKLAFSTAYMSYASTADLLVYFYERGVQLLGSDGTLTYITSNKFFRAAYGAKLRGFLTQTMRIRKLIDFGDAPVFDATAYPSIAVMTKRPANGGRSEMSILTWKPGEAIETFPQVMRHRAFPMEQTQLSSAGWNFEVPEVLGLLKKLRGKGTPLGDYVNGAIYYGIKTGFNEAFVVNQETRNRLVGEDPQCRQILKPFLRGRDVKRWRVQYAGLWLINTHNGYGGTPPVDVDDYPVIKAHLDEVERRRAAGELGEKAQKAKGLFRRDDQGRTPYNLRNCVYVPEFEKPKIIYPDIYEHQSFALDTGGHFSANTTYFIPNEKPWLLALLNSKLVEWFYGSVSNRVRGGYLRAFSDYIRQIPIASVPENEAEHLEQTIQFILIAKKNAPSADVSALEAEIDHLVYKLYDLTPEEIAIVEESTAGGSQARKTAPQPPAVEKTSRRKTTPDLPPSLPGWD